MSHLVTDPHLSCQLYPKGFERVKEKVLSGKSDSCGHFTTRIKSLQFHIGQFHIIGGAWVEHDSNMPSGESLARQFIYGQRFFQSRFNGMRCETAWLPDSFGITGALPQLIREAGMKYFFTQKLSWNNM
jgi:alpha-mannosidase